MKYFLDTLVKLAGVENFAFSHCFLKWVQIIEKYR